MRVLAVTTWLPTREHPSTGAFVVKDAQAIADLGHEVALIHLVAAHQLIDATRPLRSTRHALRDQDATAGDIPVTRILMSTTSPRSIGVAGRRLSRLSRGADLVHTMAFPTLLPMAGWRPAAPWVHTEHWSGLSAPQTLSYTYRLALPWLRPLLRRPDVVTAVCDHLAEPIGSIRAQRATAVVPCIVPRPEELQPRRPEVCAGSPSHINVVFIGALIDRKDPLLAVDVLAALLSRGMSARLRFIGEGPLADAIAERSSQAGIADSVEIVGTLDRKGVLAELAHADVFLGPTRGENFFVACAEAIQSGRPVVVGATGGHGEYIDARVGITVKTNQPSDYADAIVEVLDRCTNMTAEQISGTIADSFSPSVVAAQYQDVYDQAIDQHVGPGESA
ncbi:MAG: glycosyltransferase family 4 protein [Ornithinimicrobium sp.]